MLVGGPYLLPGLVGGGHHHRVADGESDEEVEDVCKVGGQLGHRLFVEPHEVHLTAALVHFVQQLRVRCDVLLLQDRGGTENLQYSHKTVKISKTKYV